MSLDVRADNIGRHAAPGGSTPLGPETTLSRRQVLVGGAAVAVGQILSRERTPVPLPDLVTRCRFGAYADNEPFPVDAHFALEDALGGTRLSVCSWFIAFGSPWPAAEAAKVAARGGYDILVAWEAHGVSFADLVDGRHDQYIWDFVNAAASFPGDVVLRPFHESNGDWYDWAPASGRGFVDGPDQWIAGWRHLVEVARRAGASNIRFLWCVNNTDASSTTLEALWPGADHVDHIGADAYNWSAGPTFDSIVGDVYDRVVALGPGRSFWVGETGLDGQDVGAADFYASVYGSRRFPQMAVVCWFSTDAFLLTGDAAAVAVHRAQLPRAPQRMR
ncbi:glycoside hydrolase family 26 protein [Nakamurella deserti]|uniref:glycoside hydrolase family 26 protein n=1 Tax=Nakamurella deserti TaxID=2164074 RepID=UPI0013006CC1|nr:glycosyl hydrolase [Nakamurella deserti]